MNLRLRSKWRPQGRPATLEDNAVALAFVIWRVTVNAAKNLHAERFDYSSDEQRVGVIREYLAFLVHFADRLTQPNLNAGERQRFMLALAGETARHLQENQSEAMGPGDYRASFTNLLNTRLEEYSQTRFDGRQPGFQTYNWLGQHVLAIMGEDQTNRWVIDQVVSLDGPEAVGHVSQALDNLLRSSTPDAGSVED